MTTKKDFDSIIFDLDGTLCDLSLAMAYAYNQVYKKFNIDRTITDSYIRYLLSLPCSEYKEALLEGVPEDIHEIILPYFAEYANDSCKNFSDAALYPDIPQGIKKLATKYKLFIVSNCGTNYLNLFLETASIGKCFTDALCHGTNFKSKAENIRLIIERHNLLSPCYIGDSPSDEIACLTAKVDFFFAGYGACYREGISNSFCFENFAALVNYFMEEL